jgi:hypothetical protein
MMAWGRFRGMARICVRELLGSNRVRRRFHGIHTDDECQSAGCDRFKWADFELTRCDLRMRATNWRSSPSRHTQENES